MRDRQREQYPQRWRVFFWFGAALVAMVMIASALSLRITDPEKLIPLVLSTLLYGAVVGFVFTAVATALWRRRRTNDDHQM